MYSNFHFSLVTVVICLVIISSVNTSDSVISDTPDRFLRLGGQSKSFGSNNPSDLHLRTSNKNGIKLWNSHRSQRKRGRGAEGGGGGRRGQRQRMNKNALRLLSGNADSIEGGGAFPPLFNIAPKATATVNATCGLSGREEYCQLVDAYPHRTLATQCGICDNQSRDAKKQHPIDEILRNTIEWWQSPTLQYGKQNEFVTITLDLGQVHQVFAIILTAAVSPRPASWILERSMDNASYEPWQYFGLSDVDCRRRYGVPGQTGKYVFESDTEVICSTQFSKPIPLKNGEIHISLVKNRPGSVNQSQNLMNFITARLIRIRFQGMHSTANSDNSVGWLLDSESLEKRSFYSVKQIRIIGRLHCNGHATKTVEVTNENDETMHQCVCLHNTCGPYCDQCCPLYNEKPYQQGTLTVENNCERCQCNGHASTCFYEETSVIGGVCQNCTHHTTGRNCENCVAGFYRPPEVAADSEEPCLQCECDSEGSTGICDSVSGECECREGFTGSRCEDCLPGYKGDHCQGCICDVRGTVRGGECEDHCQCKLNVEGETCSTCVSGYFGLRPDNREGCMKCFCSGVGVSCRSLEMETSSYETLDAWKVTDITKRILAYPTRDNDTGNMVFDTDELSEVEAVYWLAPRSYAGNRLTSYGSKLVIQISWIVIRGDTSGKPTTGPNIILIGRNGAKIANGDEEFSDSSASLDVLLTERGWYHVPKSVKDIVTRLRRTEYRGDPVTRIQFMAVLSDIESILIRGTFHTDQVGSVLERATLYSGGTDVEDNEWSLVEECQCPPGYTGLSCESCSFGYVRIFENSTTHEIIGKCIPCECNGHAESCDLQSGQCGKCAHNTFGDSCQRCKMGYFGNPMHGTASDCKRCACPLLEESNNFSPSCQLKKLSLDTNQYDLENDVDYVCTQCPDGFIGDHCELCDDGYYGNPLLISSACLPCPCNGGPCDPITGECVTCLGNTEGWRCERCRTGFWGNPEVSCEPCVCFDGGSSSAVCDPKTGQCECKLHFDGLKCDQCERGRADLKLDCAECGCNTNGSADQWCNPVDGQCVCKSGVDGLKCEKCDEEYFGLAADGCEECRCSIHGSTGRGCHRVTGQCECLPNVTGHKCDMCMPGFWNLTSHVGCSSCACHASGSRDNLCDTVTGRCVCKAGVGGYRCDRCLDQFYGLSSQGCQPCDRCPTPGYICDPVTGSCICPPNAKGTDCQHCQANTWNWKHRIGCENCECDAAGSIGQLCDVRTGQCTCREGYTGRSCDSCGVGYFGYPDCKRCNCNVHGSETRSDGLVQCDYRGQCPCKSLVTGLKCDICRQHTFGLHKSNAEGCTRCFCFQRSQECSQSDLSWGLIRMQGARNLSIQYVSPETVPVDEYEYIVLVQMEGTETYEQDAEIQTLNTLNLIPSSTGNVSIGAYTAFYYPLYFQLPPQFYGDRIKSYGGSLRFSLLTEGSGTLLNRNVLQQSPLVQIHSHHKLILEYYQDEPRNMSTNESFVVPLHESVWRLHSSNEQNVSRGLMMAALQNVKHIFLRGTSWADFTEVVLYNVRMDSAIYLAGSTNILAYGVEQCHCPARYESLSCQDPGRGFYRQRNRTSHSLEDIVGRAIPCHCNGRSDDCDRETGVCLNCRENSGGEHCQRCAEGFYGDPNIGECRACPCPETSRNYAKGCTVWKGNVRCICKPGYGGSLCDMCSKGYFGLPGTPNGKCEPCNCNLDGIVSDECEEENGQCNCRAGVVGRKCDRCTTERHVLEDRRCQLCDNCTLTLLDTIENTSNQLRRGISHIDLTGISAPYGKVDDYDEKLSDLDDWFSDFSEAKDTLVGFDGNEIDKLLSRSEDLKIQSRKQHDTVVKSRTKSQDILNKAKDTLAEVQKLRTGIQGTIVALNNYGSNPSHTNLDKALHEAIPILEEMRAHRDDRESYKGIWKCAADKFYYFGNTSDVVQDQLVALEQFSINMSRFNHRVSDIILNTEKTLNIIRQAEDIHEHNTNLKNYFVEDYGSIRDYEEDLLKFLNNSLTADGDILVEVINNGLEEIELNSDNVENLGHRLAKKCNETDVDLRDIKKHWLPKAKKHANRLRDRAKEYADKFQTTKDGAKVALLASTAHQNISNAINAAREAAKKAQASAKLAQEKLYTSDGISMTDRGHGSLQESRQLEKDAIEKMRKITELRKDLKLNENNVEAIKSTIRRAGMKNNNISLALEKLTNNASMESLRDNIELATELSKDMKVEGKKASALDKDIKKLREKFAKLEPDWESKLGLAEENVTEIQSNLIKANSSLIKIEMEAKRYNQDFEVANRTLGRQLQELKDKIAKAKHAAEGIKVSMDPTAIRCIRSYLPPSYGLSTSNTIKLTLALVRDAKDSPVVFIQGNGTDFIAVEMIKRRIRLLWNLGGQTEVVTHPLELDVLDAKIDEAWYQIDVNRTLNIGSLLVRRMTNSSTFMTEMPGVTAATDHKHTRFLRTPSNLVWIGGVPDSLRVKELQANPGLNVVLHQVDIDGKSLGLWNFASEDGKCGGAISGPQDASLNSNSRYFNGEGYAELKISRSRPYRKNRFAIQMAFRTFDENALLFLAVDDKNNRSISITLNYGRILFRIDYGKESKLEIITTQRYNTGKETRIEAAREFVPKGITENGSLKVNTDESLNGSPTAPITSAMLPDLSKASYYLGGVPPGFRSGITKAPGADNRYMGCMMDVQINGETYDPLEGVTFFGVDQSCKTAIKKAGFYGKGYVELPSQSLYKRANAGFVFRTLQSECLLLLSAYPPNSESDYDSSDLKGNYSISLIDGKVHVWLQTGRGKLEMGSKQIVNDGEYHVLNLIKNGRKVELTLDDELQWSKSLTGKPAQVSMPQDAGGLYFGGAPAFESYKPLAATFVPFEGAIRDVVFNNRTLLFSDTVAFENVQIGRSGPEMGMNNGNADVLMKTEPIGKSFTATPEGCQRVGSYSYEPNAFKFGDGPFSHSQLNITVRNFWQKNFNIRFDFRTFYPNGAILTAPGTKEKQKHFVNLLLKDGQLVLRVRGRKKVELLLAAKLNDGQWHQVSISCLERKVTMSVEIGDTGQKTSTQVKIPKKVSASNNMFVGGIPENGVTLPMEVEGFKGCIRKMTINNSTKDLARPGKHVNVGQCFPKVEKGSYFPGDAYAIYKKNFHVGKYLELEIDFRTSELNGVLLSVSEPNGFPALSLEIHNGNVVLSCDLGDGNPFRVESVYPSKYALCDNKWHNISALYDIEQITLRIDNRPAIISMAQTRVDGKVHTKSSLYIGGLPDIAPSGTLQSRENFKGCIRNVSIRSERRDWIDMDGLHNVLLSECLAVN